jgi:hypothetical protein
MSPAAVAAGVPVDEVPLDEVWNVVEAVWESLLGVWPAPAEPVDVGTDWLSAVVAVDGDWRGAVALSCPPRTAQHIGRTMLDLSGDEPDPDADDVDDAVREVANVLGGNVKALVPGGFTLGLPVLRLGRPDIEGHLVAEVHVGWPGHVARIGVWRTAAAQNHQQIQTSAHVGGRQQ